jgi:hypothetical protein
MGNRGIAIYQPLLTSGDALMECTGYWVAPATLYPFFNLYTSLNFYLNTVLHKGCAQRQRRGMQFYSAISVPIQGVSTDTSQPPI